MIIAWGSQPSAPTARRSRIRARTLLLLALSVLLDQGWAQDPVGRWQEVTGATRGEPRGMAVGDFDDDGLSDVAATFVGPAIIIRVQGVSAGEWRNKQTLVAPAAGSRDIPVAWERPGPDALIVLSSNGDGFVYEGWPLQQTQRLSVTSGASAAAIADVDADGDEELIVAGSAGVHVYDAVSGTLHWQQAGASVDLQVLQLDSDAALEIVLAGQASRILDGATQAQDWVYPDGFGAYLAGGRFALDGSVGFVGARDWSTATVFRASPWSPLWDYSLQDLDAVDSCDVERDGHDEIVIGGGQSHDVRIVDPQTRVDQLRIQHDDSGTTDVSARDFFGTGGCQVVFGAANPYSGKVLRVFDAASGSELHSTLTFPDSLGAVKIGDLDGDGVDELITAGRNRDLRKLRISDAASGMLLWELTTVPPYFLDPLHMDVKRILIGQADDDAAREIVLFGTDNIDARVVVVDSASRTVERHIGFQGLGPLRTRHAKDALLIDYDGDGRDDLVAATNASTTGSNGARLHVFGLDDGASLWESPSMGSGFGSIVAVLAVQSDADAAVELVAVLATALHTFDASTQLLEWSTALAGEIISAAYDPATRQMALARYGRLSLHSAANGAPLLDSFATRGETTALVALPGPRWLAYDEDHLAIYDPRDGDRLGVSEWLGPAQGGAQLDALPMGDGARIASASALGHQVHDVGQTPNIFADGFEP